MLRHYAEEKQSNWEEYLFLCELAYNSVQQSSTKRSPFFLYMGREPTMPTDLLPVKRNSPTLGAEELTKAMRDEIEAAKQHIRHAQKVQKHYADDKRRDVKFEGRQGLCSTEGITIKNESKSNKFNPKRIGPYKGYSRRRRILISRRESLHHHRRSRLRKGTKSL
eukprot:TRINITY_DN2975_c0_g1_i1.p1 TRINITY_DN2975_c0_g1~~TRINITY_DN2975_c0_g1_i1.p1  ORF type:complete len:165 (+),score=15.97 TRINITY_DN2975_c0_g1_i1:519-1013(+)